MSTNSKGIQELCTPKTLDDLLNRIHPAEIQNTRDNAVARAMNSFHPIPSFIENWDEYRRFMARFYCHVENVILSIQKPIPMDTEMHYGMCCRILSFEYGENGFRTAFEMTRTGCGGGLYAVLRVVCRQIAKEYTERNTATLVRLFLAQFSFEQIQKAIDEYIANYGRFLPSELIESNACRLRANFDKVLEQHPNLIQKMRRIR